MFQFEKDYALLIEEILNTGIERSTRNSVTKSIFGKSLSFKMNPGEFPLLLGRKMFPRGIIGEMSAFLKGPKNVKDFTDEGCNYWNLWAESDGSLNVDYGNLWSNFNGVNQLKDLVSSLKEDPYGRRHIITGWKPDNLQSLSLPCCHLLYQWYVNGDELEMIWYQRSVDTMIGLPSDVVLSFVFNVLVANEVNLKPGKITMFLGDTHIYKDHYEKALEYVERVKQSQSLPLPTYKLNDGLFNFNPDNLIIENYHPLDRINFKLLA